MNRLLIISKMRGDDLSIFPIDNSTPDDICLLHTILSSHVVNGQTVNVQNCGTAMRFLTAYFAQKEGCSVIIDGYERMRQRPIGQLADTLSLLGADIHYLAQEGFPPLGINGKKLEHKPVTLDNPQSSQFVSALMLIGADVKTNCQSPYIDMTRRLIESRTSVANSQYPNNLIERDWSAAAFWYEYVAIHGGTLFLEGLKRDSLQGDRVAAEIFKSLGVETIYEDNGVRIRRYPDRQTERLLEWDFSACPDLYPAVYAACLSLGIETSFTGLETLPLKESNRLTSMKQAENLSGLTAQPVLSSYGDHRVAMALICADYQVDDTNCISKSYPNFIEQWRALHR